MVSEHKERSLPISHDQNHHGNSEATPFDELPNDTNSVGDTDALPTLIRVSKATYDESQGVLEVKGWCLTVDPDFDLLLQVRGSSIVAPISPYSDKRPDVSAKYPAYQRDNCGWRIRLKIENITAPAVARVIFVSNQHMMVNDCNISITPLNSISVENWLKIERCDYSPQRCLCKIEGSIKVDQDIVDLHVTLSSGVALSTVTAQVATEVTAEGERHWVIDVPMTGLRDNEILTVSSGPTGGLTASSRIQIKADSPRQLVATAASVQRDEIIFPESIQLSDLLNLRSRLSTQSPIERDAGEVCYFPAFDNESDLADQYHRASWYLAWEGETLKKVTLAYGAEHAPSREDLSRPDHFAQKRLDDRTLALIPDDDSFTAALLRAGTIMVWRPLPRGLLDYLKKLFGTARIVTVSPKDPGAVEYGTYCRLPWLLTSQEKRAEILSASHERFRKVMRQQRDAGKTCSAVFGTGPSIDCAFDFDFSDCMAVVCNSIVANDVLLDHIRPAIICAGDAVSHFGVSRYAEAFRDDLIRALTTRDMYFLTSAEAGYFLTLKYPEIKERVILCEQRFTGANTDLELFWALPKLDSTLNIHMLPIATTFSDTIYMLGFDGRSPNPDENEDFWAHSAAAQYHDLVESGHQAHPTFAINRAKATEDRYLASVEDSLLSAETVGKAFYALADSYTPAIHARPAQPHCFAPRMERSRHKPQAITRLATPRGGSRALIIMQVPRRHFSGGRYHATMLAEAMAAFCDEVVVWTNNMPPWSGDLGLCPNHNKVRYVINDWLGTIDGPFDYVVLVPDGSRQSAEYEKGLAIARANNARTIFINFESPNWFNALSPEPKKLEDACNWFATACFSDIILSSAEASVPFAESFYQTLFHKPVFAVAPPAINSAAADFVRRQDMPRKKQIVLISRFGKAAAHKNINAIFDFITPEMRGYTLALIAGTSDLPPPVVLDAFRDRLEAQGLTLKLLYMISDRRKFEEIASSELMIFPSLFEGFGYPPVEAGYMGTPCVTYDLPVLKEFNSDHAHFVAWDDSLALRSKVSELLRAGPDCRDSEREPRVRQTATLEAFSTKMREILQDDPGTRAAHGFSRERFDLARRVYLDGCLERPLNFSVLNRAEISALVERYIDYGNVIRSAFDRLQALPR